MRILDLLSFLTCGTVFSLIGALLVLCVGALCFLVLGIFLIETFDITLPEPSLSKCYIVIVLIIFIAFISLGGPEYSDGEFDDEYTIVNSVEYNDGKILANGELFDTDNIVGCESLGDDVIIEGYHYKNKMLPGIGLEKSRYKKLILGHTSYYKIKDLVYITYASKSSDKGIKKVFEIIDYKQKHGNFVIGQEKEKVVKVSMTGSESVEQDEELIDLKNEVSEYKAKVVELEKSNKELEKEHKSDEEITLKWVWVLIVTVWILGIITYIVVRKRGEK